MPARKTPVSERRCCGHSADGNRQGLLALSDGCPMLGVLHPDGLSGAGANNWEFNGEPALKLQL